MNQSLALDILRSGSNVFLTGEPGAGKTHTINEYVRWLKSHAIEPAITASTGIAATHIGGMTIHSWTGMGIQDHLSTHDIHTIANRENIKKRISKARVLIIDEVSMLSPHVLYQADCICKTVKENAQPFGGMQVIFVGDFFQLPPISSDTHKQTARFAYDSIAWEQAHPVICYLDEQHRQDDAAFLRILSAIRAQSFDHSHLAMINARHTQPYDAPENIPQIYTHNMDVDRYNEQKLAQLHEQTYTFTMSTNGSKKIVETLMRGCLSPEKLRLKKNATVMFTKNDLKGAYVNGTLGTVMHFDEHTKLPIIKTRGGAMIAVEPADWTIEEDGRVRARISQLPLRLAWAITVHKSQGMSMDSAVMDLSRVFEYGQGYVALSRVRRLSGLYLLGCNTQAFQIHPDVLARDREFKTHSQQSALTYGSMHESALKKTHEDFIRACGGTLHTSEFKKSSKSVKPPKLTTAEKTLALWNLHKSLKEIADERGVQVNTIVSHIQELVEKKLIPTKDIEKLMSEKLKQHLPDIQKMFDQLQTDNLSPVHEALNKKFTYHDLRIARILNIKQ